MVARCMQDCVCPGVNSYYSSRTLEVVSMVPGAVRHPRKVMHKPRGFHDVFGEGREVAGAGKLGLSGDANCIESAVKPRKSETQGLTRLNPRGRTPVPHRTSSFREGGLCLCMVYDT